MCVAHTTAEEVGPCPLPPAPVRVAQRPRWAWSSSGAPTGRRRATCSAATTRWPRWPCPTAGDDQHGALRASERAALRRLRPVSRAQADPAGVPPVRRTVRFGKSARRKIPEALLQEIRCGYRGCTRLEREMRPGRRAWQLALVLLVLLPTRDLNSADVALHKLGTEILGRNRERWVSAADAGEEKGAPLQRSSALRLLVQLCRSVRCGCAAGRAGTAPGAAGPGARGGGAQAASQVPHPQAVRRQAARPRRHR